jgi:fructose-specific phosphotransferase system IIC component
MGKGKHTLFVDFVGLLGQNNFEVQAASIDNDGKPLQKVVVEMTPTLDIPRGWFSTFLFGILGGLIGSLVIAITIRHQFSKKNIIGVLGYILIPLILALFWIIYSWYERK